jgi:hypothetical protein
MSWRIRAGQVPPQSACPYCSADIERLGRWAGSERQPAGAGRCAPSRPSKDNRYRPHAVMAMQTSRGADCVGSDLICHFPPLTRSKWPCVRWAGWLSAQHGMFSSASRSWWRRCERVAGIECQRECAVCLSDGWRIPTRRSSTRFWPSPEILSVDGVDLPVYNELHQTGFDDRYAGLWERRWLSGAIAAAGLDCRTFILLEEGSGAAPEMFLTAYPPEGGPGARWYWRCGSMPNAPSPLSLPETSVCRCLLRGW